MTPLQQEQKYTSKALAEARKPVKIAVEIALQEPTAWDGSYLWQAELAGRCPDTGKKMEVYVVAMSMADVLEHAGRALADSFCKTCMPPGYRPAGDPLPGPPGGLLLASHEQRVVLEHRELSARLVRLGEFIDHGASYSGLDRADQALLQRQRQAMVELQFVLAARIQRFGRPA